MLARCSLWRLLFFFIGKPVLFSRRRRHTMCGLDWCSGVCWSALIAPPGFWRDADRVVNWMMLDPARLPEYVFRDPKGEAAQRLFGSTEPEARVRLMWAMGATGKFIWPIPDKGLKKRAHRVTAPTLLVWGKEDR